MDRAGLRITRASLPSLRRLASRLAVAGLPLLGLACAQSGIAAAGDAPAIHARGAGPEEHPVLHAPSAVDEQPTKVLPISLDTVLRLAEDQNAQIGVARERVNEAYAEKDVAAYAWLPKLYAGMAYYRHEGGIQNEDGTLQRSSFSSLFPGVELDAQVDLRDIAFQRVNAERKVWQQRGELSRITNDTLLDAANTYIDLLTARTGEEVARKLLKSEEEQLKRAEDLAKAEMTAYTRLGVESIQSSISGLRQSILRLHQQGDAASAKLAYLLGLGPCVELVPVDGRLIPFSLVDATPPTCDLVSQALTHGPGVRELEGLLAVIQNAIDKAQGCGKFLPTFQARMDEGGFGAGPGDSMTWDNRWDLVLQARWNLTDLVTAHDRQRVAQTKLNQVQLTYQDLRGKLTAGVQEAREAILSGQEQIQWTERQVQHSDEAYQLSSGRLKDNVPGSGATEVMQTIHALEAAHLGYLSSVSNYDKAQIRLMLLLGPSACHAPAGHTVVLPPAKPEGKAR